MNKKNLQSIFYVFLYNMCLKCQKKSGIKLVMLCKKAKKRWENGDSTQFFSHPLGNFCHPLEISLPPPGRNPETAPDCVEQVYLGYHHNKLLHASFVEGGRVRNEIFCLHLSQLQSQTIWVVSDKFILQYSWLYQAKLKAKGGISVGVRLYLSCHHTYKWFWNAL